MRILVLLAYFPAILKWVAGLYWGKTYRTLLATDVPGSYSYTGNFNRKLSYDEKYEAIRGEFQGSSELCFEIARRIIQIRRGRNPRKNWLFLYGAILNHHEAIYSGLTLRWIVSVLDTYSDMRCNTRHKLAAGEIRSFVLGLRLGFSMALQSVPDPTVAPEPLHHFPKEEIWSGIIHFDHKIGDTYRNYIQRTADELKSLPSMASAWRVVLLRVASLPPLGYALTNNAKSREVFETITRTKE